MGANFSLSALGLAIFEIANEIFVSISAGILGIAVVTHYGIKNNHLVRTAMLSSVTLASLMYVFNSTEVVQPSRNKLIFITGCDSGLGYSMAQHACELGFTVLAGCLNLDSSGAKQLRHLFGDRVRHIELDITRSTSIEVALEVTERILQCNPKYKLWAVINNAGVMVFGEFEWLTEKLVEDEMKVNLLGTFNLTRAFCPLLRQYKGRIITIASHCGFSTLPGLAVYGATKAGLLAWSDGIRVELNKYGVDVVTFIPGSFVQSSNIMAHQADYCYEMFNSFTLEQREFYGEYFKRYYSYLSAISPPKSIRKIDDPLLFKKFEDALMEIPPKSMYVHEPFKYSVYHMLFKYSPVCVRDYFVTKFMQMPEYSVPPKPVIPEGLA